jgi:hypothetical protein
VAPVASKIKVIAITAGIAAVGAALDSLTSANLGFLGSWQTAGTFALAAAIGYLKTETALAGWLRKYGKGDAADLLAPPR